MDGIAFYINPVSGGGCTDSLAESIERAMKLYGPGLPYEIHYTCPNRTEMERSLSESAGKFPVLVVAGGDGTVSNVVGIVTKLSLPVKLGIIPRGTGNDLARVLGSFRISGRWGTEGLIRHWLKGKRSRKLDVWKAGEDIYFTNYFSLGVDALISNDFNRLRSRFSFLKKFGRMFNYVVYMLITFPRIMFPLKSTIVVSRGKGDEHWCDMVVNDFRSLVFSNLRSYAGGCLISRCSRMDDGKLEFHVIRGLGEFVRFMLTRFPFVPPVTFAHRQSAFFRIKLPRDRRELRFQADGEDLTGKIGDRNEIDISHAGQVEFLV